MPNNFEDGPPDWRLEVPIELYEADPQCSDPDDDSDIALSGFEDEPVSTSTVDDREIIPPATREVLRKRIVSVPHLISEEQALLASAPTDHGQIQRTIGARRNSAVRFMSLSRDVLNRHNTTRTRRLSPISDPSGVWIVRAPMGSGKTTLIGKPFADFAGRLRATGDGGGRFLAVVHRVTLVEALANKLGTDYYRDREFRAYAGTAVSVSTCLHSVHRFPEFTDSVDCLFVDEASQVLREMSRITKVEGGTPRDIYNTIVSLIRNARYVVLADACMDDATVKWLEEIRTGEKFNIIDMPCDELGIDASFIYGKEAVGQAANSIITMVRDGDPVWVACAERSVAEQVQSLVSRECPSARIGLFTSKKKPTGAADFVANISERSREFDCFIHTGAISSGVSVEGIEHFKHVFLITGGYTLNTVDCLQMLRRVRYASEVTVAVRQKNGGDEVYTAAGGRAGEAANFGYLDEGLADWTHICKEADYKNRRADSYASNLYWALEVSGFNVHRCSDDGPAEDTQTEGKRLAATWRDGVFSAKRLDTETAEAIRRCDNATDEQLYSLERYDIETWAVLRDEPLTDIVFDMWDAGRGRNRLERFIETIYGKTRAGAVFDPSGPSTSTFGRLRVGMYRKIFDGINLLAGAVDPGQASDSIGRVCADRFAYAYVRAVPSRYGAAYTRDRGGKETFVPFIEPEKPVAAFRELLEGIGIKTAVREARVNGKRVKNAEITGVSIDSEVMQTLQGIAERRLALKDMYVAVDAPPDLHKTVPDIVRDGFDWEAPAEDWKPMRAWEVMKALSVVRSLANEAAITKEIEQKVGERLKWSGKVGPTLPPVR
jgi:hypothetical protein